MIRNWKTFLGANLAFALTTCLSFTAAHAQQAQAEPAKPAANEAEAGEEDIVVTASRGQGVRRDLIGGSVTVFDAKDLEDRQVRILSDVLRDAPGLAVSRTGTVGGLTQVRIRGTEGNHTLVLIDGIEASDPFQGEFDFATLISADVARVEVLRGQQSALYGSDAIGGVIHYITATGKEAPGLRGQLEGGSFGTTNLSGRFAGVVGPLDYSVSGNFFDTQGINITRFSGLDDGARNATLAGKFLYTPTDYFRIIATGRLTRAEADTEGQDFTTGSPTQGLAIETPDFYENHQQYGLIRAELDLLNGAWTHAFTLQATDSQRRSFGAFGPSFFTDGKREKGSYETALKLESGQTKHQFTAALDVERESFQNVPIGTPGPANRKREIDNVGIVLAYDFFLADRLGFGVSVRNDDNDRFDDAETYRVQASYRFATNTRLRGAYGTGIKNPTNFELFGFNPTSFIGNPDLKPEESEGFELGVEQTLLDGRFRAEIAYFDNELENEIFTTFLPGFVSSPRNRTTKSTQQGVEVTIAAKLAETLTLDAAYTYLDAQENGLVEVRRPEHVASLNLNWRAFADRGGLGLSARYNGEQEDNEFINVTPQTRVTLDSYTLVNLYGDYKLNDRVGLFGRVENLFDQDYEEVFSFKTQGLAGYIGVRVGF